MNNFLYVSTGFLLKNFLFSFAVLEIIVFYTLMTTCLLLCSVRKFMSEIHVCYYVSQFSIIKKQDHSKYLVPQLPLPKDRLSVVINVLIVSSKYLLSNIHFFIYLPLPSLDEKAKHNIFFRLPRMRRVGINIQQSSFISNNY